MGPAQSIIAAEDLLIRATAPADSDSPMPRAMIVVAHADDETIALGARIKRFHGAHLIHVTDSAPRNELDSRAHGFQCIDDYRLARQRELSAVFTQTGLSCVTSTCLGISDQEAGNYLIEISRELARYIADHDPEVIFTHPYEGGHPDHDACAFAVHHAVDLNRALGGVRPLIIEAPFYHAGAAGFEAGSFLISDSYTPELVYQLSEAERMQKDSLLACFTTQTETLRGFHQPVERFRIAPVYDFTRPPHDGQLFYEHFPWGMTSSRFCVLAQEAEAELQDLVRRA